MSGRTHPCSWQLAHLPHCIRALFIHSSDPHNRIVIIRFTKTTSLSRPSLGLAFPFSAQVCDYFAEFCRDAIAIKCLDEGPWAAAGPRGTPREVVDSDAEVVRECPSGSGGLSRPAICAAVAAAVASAASDRIEMARREPGGGSPDWLDAAEATATHNSVPVISLFAVTWPCFASQSGTTRPMTNTSCMLIAGKTLRARQSMCKVRVRE